MVKKDNAYLVTRPIRGEQSFYVRAKNQREAKELVNANSPRAEALDFEISEYFKANWARKE